MRMYLRITLTMIIGLMAGMLISASSVAYGQNFADLNKPAPAPEVIPAPQDARQTAAAVDASLLVDNSNYTLGVNDVVEIIVARHPEVSGQYIINNEGKVQYGFVGDIFVVGKTKAEVKDILAKELETYIVSPDVTLTIVGYNSKVVYVIGEVGVPGKIFMRGNTITVRDALLQAGLPLLSASMRKCPLITPSIEGNAAQRSVDVFKLLYEGDLRENLVMNPGDTLYIPATVLAKAMRVISPVTQPVQAAADGARPIATGGF